MNQSEDMLRDLCENAPDLVQSVAPDGRFLYVNRTWRDVLGYAPEEVARLTIADVVHADSLPHCEALFARLIAGEAIDRVETDFRARDGRRIPVEGSLSCRFEDGRPIATRGIFRDLTRRHEAEEERQEIFRLSLDMMCVAGVDGFFKQVNPAFEKTLGYPRAELLGRQFIEFVHPDDREATLAQVERLASGESVIDFHNRYRGSDGSWHWLAWRSAPLAHRGLIYAVARDITEQRETQELLSRQADDLARSNHDLEQFAYIASHDLRAPLRSIQMLVGWIEQTLADDPGKAREHLGQLRERAGRMDTLIEDLLTYARAGRGPEDSVDVDIAVLVRDLAAFLDPPHGFVVRVDPPVPPLTTARAPLEQVLRNLIGNALKHHDRGHGEIVITARPDGRFLEFRVTDDGPGIAPAFRDRAFEMFAKGHSADRVQGNGIGLALVKRLVESHGGRAGLAPVEGRGTTVWFTWPRRLDAA